MDFAFELPTLWWRDEESILATISNIPSFNLPLCAFSAPPSVFLIFCSKIQYSMTDTNVFNSS